MLHLDGKKSLSQHTVVPRPLRGSVTWLISYQMSHLRNKSMTEFEALKMLRYLFRKYFLFLFSPIKASPELLHRASKCRGTHGRKGNNIISLQYPVVFHA